MNVPTVSWSLALYVSEWAIRLVMLFVATRKRRPSSAVAWLMVIFFQPWVGLAVYLLIGRNRLSYRRARQHKRILHRIRQWGHHFEDNPNVVRPELGPTAMTAVSLAERLGEMPILGGNNTELLADSDAVIERLIQDIDAATDHVHLLFYIYANDSTGKQVSDALIRAAQRGVKCRVLADGVGSRPFFRTLASHMRKGGVEIQEALPVGIFRSRFHRIDLRNHRKVAVVDGNTAYSGSQNIIDASSETCKLQWQDLTVRLTGPAVLELQAVFVGDWFFETGEILRDKAIFPEPTPTGTVPIQALPSGPNYPTENYQRFVVTSVHSAQQQITITTPYFVPDEALMQAIQVAVLRGVRVDLIVPRKSDSPIVDAATRSYFANLLEMDVNLHLYEGGLLHAKTMSIDNAIALIGSGNFDIRSFQLNFEVNLLLYGPDITSELKLQQDDYIRNSTQLTQEVWNQRSFLRATAHNIAKLLSPLL